MKNYGLLESLKEFTAYVLGNNSMPWVQFLPDGNWEPYLPKYENQTTRVGNETSGCTVWGSLNQLETLHKFLYGDEPNYSERFIYLQVPIDPQRGTDPQNTHETIRRVGVIDEKNLPMTDTLEEYLDASDITGSLMAKGQNWLKKTTYQHEWLWNSASTRPENYIEILREALKTSPIAVSVSAWRLEGDVYVSTGKVNNHYCLLYKIDEEGHPWVFDSYNHSKKKLAKDHNIRRAKRIFLNRKTHRGSRTLLRILQEYVRILSMKPSLYDVAQKYLGTDVTPLDEVSDDIACAHTLTTLMKELDQRTPIMTGTATLYEWLLKAPQWKKVDQPEKGDIIVSPTGYGRGIGHCGVVMENDLIASNNSFGVYKGKLTENYTLLRWQKKYGIEQSLPIAFFRYVE